MSHKRKTIGLAGLLLISLCGFSQRFINFTLLQVDKTVNTRFTLAPGQISYGYKVLHSTDSVNYLEVITSTLVCGNSGANESFSDIHNTPAIGQLNYYKVQLSNSETSEVRRIFVGNGGKLPVLIIPNPVYNFSAEVRFRIFNIFNTRVQGFIYDQNGISKDFIDLTTTGDTGSLNVSALSDGMYVLWLTDGTQLFTGKFIINR
jgi:hypothetical protein